MITHHHTPRSILLTTILVVSTIVIVSTTNWIILWLAIEINLISIIPLITISKVSYEAESAIKYFLIQASSSSLILTSIIMYLSSSLVHVRTTLFISRLIIKIGIAPFHLWLPQVLKRLTWRLIIIITTWQKLGPLLIISYTLHLWNPLSLLTIVAINAFLGRLGGINQTQVRPLIAYSSISHIAWILARRSVSYRITYLYFIFYSIISIILIIPIISITKITTNKFDITTQLSSNISFSTILNLLSLGGIPPLLGFIPKWIVVLTLIKTNITLPIILIFSSIIRLFFYLILFFTRTLNSNKTLIISLTTPLLYQSVPLNIFTPIIILLYL